MRRLRRLVEGARSAEGVLAMLALGCWFRFHDIDALEWACRYSPAHEGMELDALVNGLFVAGIFSMGLLVLRGFRLRRASRRGDLEGFEALARWPGEDGPVPPDAFLPRAEEMGLLPELSDRLLTRACADARHWPAPLRPAFDISPAQLGDRLLAQGMSGILDAADSPPGRRQVEIPEAAAPRDAETEGGLNDPLQAAGAGSGGRGTARPVQTLFPPDRPPFPPSASGPVALPPLPWFRPRRTAQRQANAVAAPARIRRLGAKVGLARDGPFDGSTQRGGHGRGAELGGWRDA